MYLSVKSVQALQDHTLRLTFENNEVRFFDVKPFLNTGLFVPLRDEKLFQSVHISFDTIAWSNQADIDPEVLYDLSSPELAESGKLVTV